MATLLITKETGGYFSFVVDGNTAEKVTNMRNDVFAIGNILHFKTATGANIIKTQNINVTDITLIASGSFTFTTVPLFLAKLIDVGYYDWLSGGGSGTGVDRFDELLDTFDYFGKAGQVVIVASNELGLTTVALNNVSKFTELDDTPTSIIANKMLVGNSAGTAIEWKDVPSTPAEYLNSVGTFHYSDLATQTVPISVTATVDTKLTNDGEGTYTNVSNAPYGVSSVWDSVNNQFDFSSLSIGDLVHIRPDLEIDLVGTNTSYEIYMKFASGTATEWNLSFSNAERKSTDIFHKNSYLGFDISNDDTRTAPAEIWIKTDANATVKVNGWYIEVLRKNINIIDIVPEKFPSNTPNATVEVGGVPVDEPLANRTAIDVLTQVLVKYLAPLFTSQSCNYPSTVEVGTTVSGSGLFTWVISNETNLVPNSVNIFDVNSDDYLATGLANDGSETVTLNSLILNSNNATQVWKISAENTNSEVLESSNITTTAKFKRFFGATSATPTTGTARSLGSEFQSANAQTFTLNTGSTLTKFAVCLPTGVTISSVIDLDALNLNITTNYISLGTININDIGGTSRVYNLYEMNIGAPYSSNHRHQITTI
jgi:hypothetical protein